MNHTPGPWKHNAIPSRQGDPLKFSLACAVWANDVPVCTTRFGVGKWLETDAQTQDANARLIAAAPDLLEACKRLLAGEATLTGESAGDVENWNAYRQIEAAVAKAEGREP